MMVLIGTRPPSLLKTRNHKKRLPDSRGTGAALAVASLVAGSRCPRKTRTPILPLFGPPLSCNWVMERRCLASKCSPKLPTGEPVPTGLKVRSKYLTDNNVRPKIFFRGRRVVAPASITGVVAAAWKARHAECQIRNCWQAPVQGETNSRKATGQPSLRESTHQPPTGRMGGDEDRTRSFLSASEQDFCWIGCKPSSRPKRR